MYNARAMVRVANVRPAGFWGLWCRCVAGVVVVGRNDYGEVEVVVDEGFGYAVAMAVVGVVVGAGFGYAVEL
jgi:hypothetical protein